LGRFNWRPCFNHSANGAKLSTMKRHFHRCRGSISLDKRTPSSAGPCETRRVVESLFPVTQSSTAKPRPSQSPARQFDPIPLLDLHRQYQQIREEVLAAVERVCSSQQYILGAEVEALEREIAAFTGASAAVGCASGTDALWLALLSAGVQAGDAVVTTAFSFFASASAIVRAGARPVLADVDPDTLNLSPECVKARLRAGGSYKIRTLLPVHLYGQCADVDALQQIADEFQLSIIEDAAQAIGAKWRGRSAGSIGMAATFSFYPTKNLSAYGDAGLVTTSDLNLAEHMRKLRNHGSSRRYHHEEFGWNCRMDAIQAAILRVKLPHIETWNQQRRQRAATYDRLLADAGLASKRVDAPVTPIKTSPHAFHVFHQYVIRTQRRDELRKFLGDRKIGTEIYYPVPLHLQPCFAYLGYGAGDLPQSERAAAEVLALPMFPELTEAEQESVVESIAEFYS
jgi:dTDP-4-amino-4,6-dideoxygalactose transaminase